MGESNPTNGVPAMVKGLPTSCMVNGLAYLAQAYTSQSSWNTSICWPRSLHKGSTDTTDGNHRLR